MTIQFLDLIYSFSLISNLFVSSFRQDQAYVPVVEISYFVVIDSSSVTKNRPISLFKILDGSMITVMFQNIKGA